MRNILLPLLPLAFLALSCAVPVKDPYSSRPKPRVSATSVVSAFLEALRDRDFNSAYENIHIFNSDREGYVSRLRFLYERYDMKITGYRVLATQLFRDSAIVVAELSVDYLPPGKTERATATYRNRYDLAIPENRWKIVKDSCIENCAAAPEAGGEGEPR